MNSHKLQRKAKFKTAGTGKRKRYERSDFSMWVDSRRAEITPPPSAEEVAGYQEWMFRRTEECELEYQQWIADGIPKLHDVYGGIMINFNAPIKIFYANLLFIGVKMRVKDGQLRISGAIEKLSPVYQEEIVKRKSHLIEMLSQQPPDALRPYFFRLLSVNEVKEASVIANQMKIELTQMPVAGGWLVGLSHQSEN